MQIVARNLRDEFRRNSFVIFKNILPNETCELLKKEAERLVSVCDRSELKHTFSARTNAQRKDHYFLTSGDKIRFFLEEHDGDRINKIGHALHELVGWDEAVFEAVVCVTIKMQDSRIKKLWSNFQ